jgi:hypothetical protein
MVGRWWCCSVVHREEEKSREMKRRTVAARGREEIRGRARVRRREDKEMGQV